jgi:hypothetical protein
MLAIRKEAWETLNQHGRCSCDLFHSSSLRSNIVIRPLLSMELGYSTVVAIVAALTHFTDSS